MRPSPSRHPAVSPWHGFGFKNQLTGTLIRSLMALLVVQSLTTTFARALVVRPQPEAQETLSVDEETVDDPRLEKYQLPSDAQTCPEWTAISPTAALASFVLSASSDLTFFISRGAETKGSFEMYSGNYFTDYIFVNVTVEYEDADDLRKSKACRAMKPFHLEGGVMIWASEPLPRARFHFSVEIPQKPRYFGDFSVDFNSGVYEVNVRDFDDWWRPVWFGVQRYKTRDAFINFGSMNAAAAYFQTTNAPVNVIVFGVSNAHLRTSNAPIIAFIELEPKETASSNLQIHTTNALILSIFGFASDYYDTLFKTSISTTNEEILAFMANGGPFFGYSNNPKYIIDISTTNAAASLHLPSDYEGNFHLETTGSGSSARILWDDKVEDPTKAGRTRSLEVERYSDTWADGKTYWGDNSNAQHLGDARLSSREGDVIVWTTRNDDFPWIPLGRPVLPSSYLKKGRIDSVPIA